MELHDALQNLMDSVCALSPELSQVLNNDSLSEEEKLMTLLGIVQKTPALQDQIMALASQNLGDSDDSPKQPLPRINPLAEGALIERLQFDGDAPEFRTGPLPENANPAVPVETDIKNPVALGGMLNAASKQVKEAIEDHQQKRIQAMTHDDGSLKMIKSHGELIADLTSIDHDITTYRRGEVPKPVPVETPSGGDLILMTESERQTSAWKFLSTTQGRQTAVNVIQDMIIGILQTEHGMTLTKHEYDPRERPEIIAVAKWLVSLGSPGSSQPAFSFIDTAAKILAKKLSRAEKLIQEPAALEVIAINQIESRTVGWAARIINR